MKTKFWLIAIGCLLAVCVGLSLLLLWPGQGATYAEVYSDGELRFTLDLRVEQTVKVESQNGVNVITVKAGKVAVTEADCPDHYCMDRGYCSGGAQIVCLPNRLVIRFVGKQSVDGVVG